MFAAPYFFYQNYSETIRKAFAKRNHPKAAALQVTKK